jgi:zinc transport system ATP-binding protein
MDLFRWPSWPFKRVKIERTIRPSVLHRPLSGVEKEKGSSQKSQMAGRRVILHLDLIKLGYNEPLWIHPISLKVNRGDFVLIFGPSGGGKSTLLKAMMGMVRLYMGKTIQFFRPEQMGYLPQAQEFNRLMPLSVAEFVKQGCRPRLRWQGGWKSWGFGGRARAEYHAETNEALKQALDLQRVALARAIVSEPRVLMIDELGRYLDPEGELELLDLLQEYQKSHPTCAIVMVSHNLQYLKKIPQARVIWVNHYDQEFEEIGKEKMKSRFTHVLNQ